MANVLCALLVLAYFAVAFYFLYTLISDLLSNQPGEPKATKKQIILWLLLSFLWPLALFISIIDHLLDEGIE